MTLCVLWDSVFGTQKPSYPKLARREGTSEKLQRPEDTELAGIEFTRSEVNLLVFPFFALTTRGLKRKLESEFRAVAERDGDQGALSRLLCWFHP